MVKIDDIADFIEQNMPNLFTKIVIDMLSEDDMAITLRHSPSAPSNRFFDQSFDNVLAFQILVKHPKQRTALVTISEMALLLERLDTKVEGLIKCELNVNPTLVEQTAKGNYIYTALFNVTYHIN